MSAAETKEDKPKLIFKIKQTGKKEFKWFPKWTNGRVANHNYNEKEECQKQLDHFLQTIKDGNYEVVDATVPKPKKEKVKKEPKPKKEKVKKEKKTKKKEKAEAPAEATTAPAAESNGTEAAAEA